MRTRTRMSGAGAALMVLVGMSLGSAEAATFTVVDAAWKEATILAGVPSTSLARPQTISGESTPAGLESPAPLPYYVMVEGFLGAIYDQISASPKLEAFSASLTTSKDGWVRDKLGWKMKSRAYSEPAVVRLASAAANTQIH